MHVPPVADLFELSGNRLRFNANGRPDGRRALEPETWNHLERLDLLPLAAYLLRHDPAWLDLAPDIATRLDRALANERARSLRLADGLERVIAALARAGIPVMLLKGADLGFHVYPAQGLRRMLDLDLLVPLNRLEQTSRVLTEIGFREDTSCYSRDWYVRCVQHLPPLEDASGFIHLDVHGALVPAYSPFAPEDLLVWSNTQASLWPPARRLSRELMIWHLVLHAQVQHLEASGVRERLHVDLLALVARSDREPIDWASLVALARHTRTAFALAEAIGRLARAPGAGALTPIAARFADVARARRSRELAVRAVHRLRHLAPFLGSGAGVPPDAWRQFVRRPLRTWNALRRR